MLGLPFIDKESTCLYLIGAFFIGLTLILLPRKLQELEVGQSPSIVTVRIYELPHYCGLTSKARLNMRIEYQGKLYSKQLSHSTCLMLSVGQDILMKHLPQYPEIFLYEQDSGKTEMVSMAGLFLIGIISICTGIYYRKNNK